MMKNLLFVCCWLAVQQLFGQAPASFQAVLSPSDAVVRIDEKLVRNGSAIELPAGTYVLELWAPKFALVKDTVSLTEGKTFVYRKGLKTLAEDFKAFRKEQNTFRQQRLNRNLSTIGYAGIGIGLGVVANNQRKANSEDLLAEADEINEILFRAIDPVTIKFYSDRFEEIEEEYEKEIRRRNTIIAVATPLAVTAIGLSIYGLIKNIKRKPTPKPVYQSENPFADAVRSATPNLGMSPQGGTQLGVTFTF